MAQVTPFLMFVGDAEAAIELYVLAFEDGHVESLERYGPDTGTPGKVEQAVFWLGGQRLRAFDSPVTHDFGFTPSLSLFVELDSEAAIDAAFDRLGADGGVLMPLDANPFARRFAWITDRFGVSWQLVCR